jgi:hypothetical protein
VAAADDATAFRLVTRLFLRRLIHNDLISPYADRHESLAMVYALIVSLAVFATFFLSTNYLSAFIQLPGTAALSALSDRFLFIAASVAVSALAALIVWDALALEPRDAAILGPLPIDARTISHAKLAAAMVFGVGLTIALNTVPSILYPLFLTLNIRGTSGATVLRLIAGHAATVSMAGLFGFFGIVAIRGSFRLVLGEHAFERAASGLQSLLVLGMVTGLLVSPTVRASDVRGWVNHAIVPRWPAQPVLWFLGANETLAGYSVVETPIVLPPRFHFLPAFLTTEDRVARATYRQLLPGFAALARRAWLSFAFVTVLALATFLWNNRRLPDRAAGVPLPSRARASVRRIAERCTDADPEAQAGFFFALQTLTRSAPHRTIIAIATAVGLTHGLIVLAKNDARSFDTPPLSALAIAIMLLLSLLAGIAHAVTVPAAPAANWAFRMAWLGDDRGYLAGVKHASMLMATGSLVLLLPLHFALLGLAPALVHSLLSVLIATVAMGVLFLPYRKLPFACSYVPIENPKLVWPAAFASLLLVTYGFAAAERWALETGARAAAFAALLAGIAILVRAIDRAWRRERQPIEFDDRPAAATQRLGLFDHIVVHD